MFTAATSVIVIYAAAALLPCIILLSYIYRLDKIEKEPGALLVKLLFGGVLACIVSFLLEILCTEDVDGSTASLQVILINALLVAVIEEGSKFFFLKKFSWKNPAFNYRFDGVVYAIFVSLGFAAVENLLYVFFHGGLSVAVSRGLLSIPGHMSFAAYMGIYYGRAKVCDSVHDDSGSFWNLLAGFLFAAAFHMLYDSTLMIGSDTSTLVFVVVVLFIYIYVFARLRKEAATDRSIQH